MKNILVACSGGADSIALAKCLHDILKNNRDERLVCIHYDHSWSDKSVEAASFVKDFCEREEIEFFCEKSKEFGRTSEDKARKKRFEFFQRACSKYKTKQVFLAHHLDDQLETIIFRLARGTGTDGSSGIKFITELKDYKIELVRPLLNIPKELIFKYCKAHNLNFFEDTSNYDTDIKRNLIRHEILPLFKKLNVNYKDSLLNFVEQSATENEFIKKYLEDLLQKEPNIKNSIMKFKALHTSLQRVLLKDFLVEHHISPSFEKIERLRLLILSPDKDIRLREKKISLGKNIYFECKEDKFNIVKEFEKIRQREKKEEKLIKLDCSQKTQKLLIEKLSDLEANEFSFQNIKSMREALKAKKQTVYADFSNFLSCELILRERKPGDRFNPINSSYSCKLKDFLINRKIKNKDSLSVLVERESKNILCIVSDSGLEISELISVKKDRRATHRLSLLEISDACF